MEAVFAGFGTLLPGTDAGQLHTEGARRLLAACEKSDVFDVIALRSIECELDGKSVRIAEGIVVDCCDGTVPSRSPVGIRNRERLLLIHRPGGDIPYEVCALRTDFPATLHQNHVGPGEPRSLCLYFEPWSTVERAWTPERHLARVAWWLRETSLGTLHRNDQPLERMYFVTPWHLVLPPDFCGRSLSSDEVLSLHAAPAEFGSVEVIIGKFRPRHSTGQPGNTFTDVVPMAIAPVVHRPISDYPSSLRELEDQLAERGSSVISELKHAIESQTPTSGLEIKDRGIGTVIVIRMPVIPSVGAEPERIDLQGVVVRASLAQLGIACGAPH